MQDPPAQAEVNAASAFLDEEALAKQQMEAQKAKRRQARIDANQARIHQMIQQNFEKKTQALREWLDCYDVIQQDLRAKKDKKKQEKGFDFPEKGSNGCVVSASDLDDLVNAVLSDQAMVWSTGNKGLIQRAIKADSRGYAVSGILNHLPLSEMSPGMVEAFMQFLTRKEPEYGGYVKESQLRILKAINRVNEYSWRHDLAIPLDPAAGEHAWGPVIKLMVSENSELAKEAREVLKRSNFNTEVSTSESKP